MFWGLFRVFFYGMQVLYWCCWLGPRLCLAKGLKEIWWRNICCKVSAAENNLEKDPIFLLESVAWILDCRQLYLDFVNNILFMYPKCLHVWGYNCQRTGIGTVRTGTAGTEFQISWPFSSSPNKCCYKRILPKVCPPANFSWCFGESCTHIFLLFKFSALKP